MVEVEKKGNIAVHIAYVKPSSFFFFKWIRFWTAYRRMIRQIEDIDVVHVHRIFPLGIFALLLKYRKKYHYIISEHWTGFHLTR